MPQYPAVSPEKKGLFTMDHRHFRYFTHLDETKEPNADKYDKDDAELMKHVIHFDRRKAYWNASKVENSRSYRVFTNS